MSFGRGKGRIRDQVQQAHVRLVTALYQLLAAKGFDPANHLVVGDFNDFVDGNTRSRFGLYLSYVATEIVLKTME